MLIPWHSGCAHASGHNVRNWALNQKPTLLLHCDGADAAVSFPNSGAESVTITVGNDAQVDTAQSKWGGAAALLDGTGDYLKTNGFFSLAKPRWYDFWVKHADHAGTEVYIGVYEDSSYYWYLSHIHGSGLYFHIQSGALDSLTTVPAGEITDTNWHHIAIGVENRLGLYKDGTQVGTCVDPTAYMATVTGPLEIGAINDGASDPFAGHMDEIRHVTSGNPFGAAPVSGLTDTIVVPTKPYISWA